MQNHLSAIQKRFENETEKEHWERLKTLLFSEDKENVVMGMNLLETLEFKNNGKKSDCYRCCGAVGVCFRSLNIFRMKKTQCSTYSCCICFL